MPSTARHIKRLGILSICPQSNCHWQSFIITLVGVQPPDAPQDSLFEPLIWIPQLVRVWRQNAFP
eukprot:2807429-Amphidinium_carterae.2